MIDALQIAVTLFGLFALSRAVLRVKEGNIPKNEGIFWVGLWIAVIAAVWMKSQLQVLQPYFNIGRPVDVLVYLSIIVLFYFSFRVYVRLTEIEGSITKLVQEIALMKKK